MVFSVSGGETLAVFISNNHIYNTWGWSTQWNMTFQLKVVTELQTRSFLQLDVTHGSNSLLDVFAGFTYFPPWRQTTSHNFLRWWSYCSLRPLFTFAGSFSIPVLAAVFWKTSWRGWFLQELCCFFYFYFFVCLRLNLTSQRLILSWCWSICNPHSAVIIHLFDEPHYQCLWRSRSLSSAFVLL